MSSQTMNDRERTFLPAAGRDLFLPLYDPLTALLGGNRARKYLIEQANVRPGQSILDIGCGTGTFALKLKQQCDDIEVVGLDPDPKALRRAKAKARRARVSVQFDRGFSDELPYETRSFDRVFSSLMFHHLEEEHKKKTLTEVLRVLKAGGSFHLLDFTGGHGHQKDNSGAGLVELMRRAGFKNVEMVREGKMLFGLLRTAYFRGGIDNSFKRNS